MKNKKIKNDILLILALIVLAGAVRGCLMLTRRSGGEAVVTVDGETVSVLPLREDTSLVVHPSDGCANTVVVEDGGVCVECADCPDRLCVRQGWIRYEGESIVCLPHKLVVTIRGGASGNVDAAAR